MSTFMAWLASQGASLLLGALAQVVTSAIQAWQQSNAQSELGRITAERDQALAANKAKDAELYALRNAPTNVDEAAARLDAGTA
jgi:hypothetical protein